MHVQSQSWLSGDREILGTCWPVTPDWTELQASERPCLKNRCRFLRNDIWVWLLTSTHKCTHVHTLTHTLTSAHFNINPLVFEMCWNVIRLGWFMYWISHTSHVHGHFREVQFIDLAHFAGFVSLSLCPPPSWSLPPTLFLHIMSRHNPSHYEYRYNMYNISLYIYTTVRKSSRW